MDGSRKQTTRIHSLVNFASHVSNINVTGISAVGVLMDSMVGVIIPCKCHKASLKCSDLFKCGKLIGALSEK